ncbi:testis-expressed protein 13D-like isoform X1 [Cervus elaphus]|uniref:testis-expressed protein 13D-like isoform X1 n=1 Tax=Cervus canadensis TaxID=1574408 RepID=UPI001CA36914|nr:testis-expressed protein 13D-like isoform X1 [Cervus canadensis]XP_043752630.1 testis-expressed protein 13D-like isoform X1 [Cervus elaphus]
MALDLGDPRSGFRHSDVVTFINQEVLRNGGGSDFYVSYRSRPWNEIEDELQSVLADTHVPRNLKRACAWSALALGVRVATRQREQQARRIQRLQEQVEERETAAWALASQLQRLREERKQMIMQLRRTRQDLQQALSEREALRGQLLQAERQSQAAVVSSRSPQLRADTWPLTTEERNKLLAATSQRRQLEAQREEAQNASAGSVQGAQDPWVQVVQPPAPMPCPMHMPCPMPFQFPLPPPRRVLPEAQLAAAPATAYPAPQMPAGVMYAPAMWPVVVSQEEVAPPWDQRIEGQGEGPHFGNPVGHFQDGPTNQQPQDQLPRTPDAPGPPCEAEEGPAPHV